MAFKDVVQVGDKTAVSGTSTSIAHIHWHRHSLFIKHVASKPLPFHFPPGMPSVLDWTDDNFSMCFGVNHLGHFLLTNLLLGRLKESAPSRVVTLTCSNYKYQKLDFQDLNYNLLPFFTYCRSKLANIYFTQELARLMEGKGVTAYSVHPGEWHPCRRSRKILLHSNIHQ